MLSSLFVTLFPPKLPLNAPKALHELVAFHRDLECNFVVIRAALCFCFSCTQAEVRDLGEVARNGPSLFLNLSAASEHVAAEMQKKLP